MRSRKSFLGNVLLSFVFITSACQSRHETVPLNSLDYPTSGLKHNHTRAEMRHPASTNPSDQHDDWFVGIAVSGGGSRAANFTAACFFALEDAGIMPHVRYISSVSGGSVAAAYYCVSSKWDYATVQHRLTHRFQTDV